MGYYPMVAGSAQSANVCRHGICINGEQVVSHANAVNCFRDVPSSRMHLALAISIFTRVVVLAATVPRPARQRTGTATPITENSSSSLANPNQNFDFDALNSHTGISTSQGVTHCDPYSEPFLIMAPLEKKKVRPHHDIVHTCTNARPL